MAKIEYNVVSLFPEQVTGIDLYDENDIRLFRIKFLNESNMSLGLKDLSIGMSSDYKKALNFNATFLRIGTEIFGERT